LIFVQFFIDNQIKVEQKLSPIFELADILK